MSARSMIRGTPVAQFALKCIAETKVRTGKEAPYISSASDEKPRRNSLSRYQEAHDKDPDFIAQDRVLALTVANMIADADTTAISLRAIFYNQMSNPEKLLNLRAQIGKAAINSGTRGRNQLLSWSDIRELPYLSAVINESLRTHPTVGLPLEIITPGSGLNLGHTYIPTGTNIGCNALVLHLDEKIWGAQPERCIPERWIDTNESRKSEMEDSLFSFGAGSRTCIGKNISYLKMYKLVPALLREFDVGQPSYITVEPYSHVCRSRWRIPRRNGSCTTLGL